MASFFLEKMMIGEYVLHCLGKKKKRFLSLNWHCYSQEEGGELIGSVGVQHLVSSLGGMMQ